MEMCLVQPSLSVKKERASHPHGGLAYLGAIALNRKWEVRALDAQYEMISNDELIQKILERPPDLLGITARTPDIESAHSIATVVKQQSPFTRVVVGGAHATAMKERTLAEFAEFDMAVVGEGEETLGEILNRLSANPRRPNLAGIAGLIQRRGDGIGPFRNRDPITDLDKLPFPAWHLFNVGSDVALFTSRGCPYRCLFCQRVMGNKVRSMTPARVISEMEHNIEKYKSTFFQIEDEVFGVRKKWVNVVLDEMIARGIHKKVRWAANSRVNVANETTYKKMKQAGCDLVGFGIESGNQAVLDRVHKGFKLDQAVRAISMAKRAGLRTAAFYIIGHPHETRKTALDTVRFAAKLNTTYASFGVMVPYPGSEIYEMAKAGDGGYTEFTEDWHQYTKYFGNPISLEKLSKGDLKNLQRAAYLYFYLRNFRFGDFAGFVKKFIEFR